jgi:hypothetical protein
MAASGRRSFAAGEPCVSGAASADSGLGVDGIDVTIGDDPGGFDP